MPPEATALSDMLEAGVLTGELEMDDRGNVRFIPNDEERKKMENEISDLLSRTLTDYESLFQEAVDNVKCYRHAKVTIQGVSNPILPAPIARIPADHIIASTFTTVMNARPLFSVDPYFGRKYPVQIPAEDGVIPGVPGGTLMAVERNSEDVAKYLERGLEFKLRERLDFERKVYKSIRGAVIGCPFWWKVSARPAVRDVLGPKVDGAFIDVSNESRQQYRRRGEVVQIDLVPFFNLLKPVDVDDDEIDESPMVFERDYCEPADIIRGFHSEEFFLIEDEEAAKKVSQNLADVNNEFQQALAVVTEKKSPQKPRQRVPKWLVWLHRDARYKDPVDSKIKVKRLNLIAEFVHGSKPALLNCFLNPNEHQTRPYVFADQMEEGDSTVKILRWHQDVATHLMQAQIKNAFIANNISYSYPPESEAEEWFRQNPVIQPGGGVGAGLEGTDWKAFSAGSEHESLLPTWQAVVSEARVASKVSGAQTGEMPSGRMPAATMSQAIAQGSQEALLFLRRMSHRLSKVVRLYLETARQFQPMGETVPMYNAAEKQLVEIPFRFPVGEVLDNFRIALTAAEQALARERDSERIAMWKNVLMQDSEFVGKVAAAIVDQKTTPPLMGLFEKALKRNERLVTKIIQLSDTDEEEFDLSGEIDALIKEQNMIREQARMAQEMANANQIAQGGQAVSGPAGQANPGGPAGPPQQPGIPAAVVAPPAGGVPGGEQIQ